eukprot:CAMPEP_0185039730 /NCGR_PEP_ID=MMETSP1103-20130426/36908_1 /TAXON_ID=36769 /ORGANISM="Paraphysomonas bandaiensis, Strain Caron Lab Isolate" /LENGTH=948 /DNA_ID=CAMNT_0027578743 /DNA_START=46 /DNA_END=2892 /DNA_ORIENTATION=-
MRWICLTLIWIPVIYSQVFSHDRIRGDDEPRIVSHHVLEGVTEPFELPEVSLEPAWKSMKALADKKASEQMIQAALHEYGQLIRHPYMFGEMPMEERYDVFLSMSKLLKMMGFYQRAELLLYEAMSYSKEPHEAHFQLGLLLLDKEDVDRAKMHFKNCLFYKESDTLILIYLSTILLTEGKVHEAKFYVSRILNSLDSKLQKLSSLFGKDRTKLVESSATHGLPLLRSRVEDLAVKVYRGEFIFIPSATLELYGFFTNLIDWMSRGEMKGRFVFDLGQSLYERGRPVIGLAMMRRGLDTSDVASEGRVSMQVVRLRHAMEYPVVPNSVWHIIETYLNTTEFLGQYSASQEGKIHLENVIDVFWPLPLVWWSALPMAPVLGELVENYFDNRPVRHNISAQQWITHQLDLSMCGHGGVSDNGNDILATSSSSMSSTRGRDSRRALKDRVPVEIGILGGHFNGHAVGQFILHRVLRNLNARRMFSITLIALPLVPDTVTSKIAEYAHRIVNLPADSTQAWAVLDRLELDVLLFPDWQPFPDQQSVFLQSTRIAPVQVCVYTRGSSCSSATVDYYILPTDAQDSYLAGEGEKGRSPLLERWSEQVVLLDWPVFTPSSIDRVVSIAAAPAFPHKKQPVFPEEEKVIDANFMPNEYEGQVFFEGQAVALLPLDPSYVHPLMDEAIFTLLRSVPHMQVVIALPEAYAHVLPSASPQAPSLAEYDTPQRQLSVEWAKKLVRRFWSRGGNLHQRIRLLPSPLSDARMIQLMRRADVVLDSFPIGASLHPLGLALSVGTPVVTMRPGITLRPTQQQSSDLRKTLIQMKSRYSTNLAYKIVSHLGSAPWVSTISPLGAFYERVGLGGELVADSVAEYVAIAESIAIDKEKAYELRVRTLDVVDEGRDEDGAGPQKRTLPGRYTDVYDETMVDLERFLMRIGKPWANARAYRQANCDNSS